MSYFHQSPVLLEALTVYRETCSAMSHQVHTRVLWCKCVLRHETLQKTTAQDQTLCCCHDYLLAKQLHINYNQDLKREKTMVSFPGMLFDTEVDQWLMICRIYTLKWMISTPYTNDHLMRFCRSKKKKKKKLKRFFFKFKKKFETKCKPKLWR